MLDSSATEIQRVAANQRLKPNEAPIPVLRTTTSLSVSSVAWLSVQPTVLQYQSIGANYEIIAESTD